MSAPLRVRHLTRYDYEGGVALGLQRLRLSPAPVPSQRVHRWSVRLGGLKEEARFADAHGNAVALASVLPGTGRVEIEVEGEAEALRSDGIVGPHEGPPLWLYLRRTALTSAGPAIRDVAGALDGGPSLGALHRLAGEIRARMPWTAGATDAATTGEAALAGGAGVCQDHAHAFVAACRSRGVPARYVSGYLLIEGRDDQDAAHAWAEAHVDGLGWTGFDVSNGYSPDDRYVRLCSGLDYRDAAPVTGIVRGTHDLRESLTVRLRVTQSTVQSQS